MFGTLTQQTVVSTGLLSEKIVLEPGLAHLDSLIEISTKNSIGTRRIDWFLILHRTQSLRIQVPSKKVGLGWVPGGSKDLLRRYDWIPRELQPIAEEGPTTTTWTV